MCIDVREEHTASMFTVKEKAKEHPPSSNMAEPVLLDGCLPGFVFNSEDGGSTFLCTSAGLHGVTSQKKVLLFCLVYFRYVLSFVEVDPV
jgi:hypothetical protein